MCGCVADVWQMCGCVDQMCEKCVRPKQQEKISDLDVWMCGNRCAAICAHIRKIYLDVRRMCQWMRIYLSAYMRIVLGCVADVRMNAHLVEHIYAKCT